MKKSTAKHSWIRVDPRKKGVLAEIKLSDEDDIDKVLARARAMMVKMRKR